MDTKEFIIGLLAGAICGAIVMVFLIASALKDYSKVSKNSEGYYLQHDGKIYKLQEVK